MGNVLPAPGAPERTWEGRGDALAVKQDRRRHRRGRRCVLRQKAAHDAVLDVFPDAACRLPIRSAVPDANRGPSGSKDFFGDPRRR